MPYSINIPFSDVISARTKAFLPAEELKLYFETKNVDPSKPIVCSCGTGVTAAVLDAALTEADTQRKDGNCTMAAGQNGHKEWRLGMVSSRKMTSLPRGFH